MHLHRELKGKKNFCSMKITKIPDGMTGAAEQNKTGMELGRINTNSARIEGGSYLRMCIPEAFLAGNYSTDVLCSACKDSSASHARSRAESSRHILANRLH
jgi:hypothetical protein